MAYTKRVSVFTGNRPMNSDAQFRAFFSLVDAALQATGWVYTSQTGDFNLGSGVRPTAGTDLTRFRVYALADNGVGGLPTYYLRFAWGGNTNAFTFGVTITIGNALDGSGNMTGATVNYKAQFRSVVMDAAGSQTWNCYFCSNTGSDMWFCINPGTETTTSSNNNSDSLFFSCCRTKDPTTYAADARGLILFSKPGTYTASTADGTSGTLFIGANCQTIYSSTSPSIPAPQGGTGASMSGSTKVFPFTEPFDPGNISMNALAYFYYDLPRNLDTRSFTINGATFDWMALGPQSVVGWNATYHYLAGNVSTIWSTMMPWTGSTV